MATLHTVTAVMENPWPLANGRAVLGLLLAGLSLQRGSLPRLAAAGALLAGAVVVVCWSLAVQTPGERAADIVWQMIQACEQTNLAVARSLVASDATIAFGSDGVDDRPRSEIDLALDSLRDRHRIEENYIFDFDAATIADDTGSVDVSCRTKTVSSFAPIMSHWIIEVRRQPDDSWVIHHILFRTLKGRDPPPTARLPRNRSP